MKSSDFLFRLIKAMSKGDRRNFKLYARLQDGDKQYIKLFDAIDRQQEYDEADILKQFEGERFTNQLSVAKNYLYNYILKTLHIFRKDPKTELNAILHQVQILMGKNLFEQAQKLLRKAKHLAERQERFPEMLFILENERLLWQKREQSREFEAFIEQIQQEEERTLARISNLQAYVHIYDKVHRILKRTQNARDPEAKSKAEAIIQMDLVSKPELALSVRSKLRRLDILADCSRISGDSEGMLAYQSQLVAAYEQNEDILREKSLSYIKALCNQGVLYYYSGYHQRSFEVLAKLKDLKAQTEEEEIHIFEKYYQLKFGLCVENRQVEEGKAVIAEFEREYPSREGTIMKSVELSMFYLIGYFYVMIGEPAKGLDWVNRVLNEPRTELRTDIQSVSRILNLIIHYHLGNWDYIDYEIKSVARFLNNREGLFAYERTVLKYLRQLSDSNPSVDRTAILREFRKEVENLSKNEFERPALQLFDMKLWIDSQINCTTMCQVAEAKVEG